MRVKLSQQRIFMYISVLVIFVSTCATTTMALNEKYKDFTASVEVAPVFGLEMTHKDFVFHRVRPGEQEILGEGSYFNEVTCRSNSGRPWSLQAQLVSLRHEDGNYEPSADNLSWRVVQSDGEGTVNNNSRDFSEFEDMPHLVYSSAGDDLRGKKVKLQFQYSLSIPANAPAGNYEGQVRFEMMENQ